MSEPEAKSGQPATGSASIASSASSAAASAEYNNFDVLKSLWSRKRASYRKSQEHVSIEPGEEPATAPGVQLRERKCLAERPSSLVRKDSEEGEGRLSRWFSLRKSSNYDIPERPRSLTKMWSVSEDSEPPPAELLVHRRLQPPSLPPAPSGLTQDQLKRRHIVQSIVHSENNYVASLQILVNDYMKVLEDSHPPILSSVKLGIIFKKMPELLHCHNQFRVALSEAVRRWDRDERLGDVFIANFSKALVLDIYSEYINNFSAAMETIKQEAKRKSAFADFLKMRQMGSPDRLSLFGLMVKPVQRFPQFIMLLQDLLKDTPQGHHDRMTLQLALTQLETLAEMLNERKRESEQFKAFRETLRRLNGKFSTRSLADERRCLLREDSVTRLEFGISGSISRSKRRRLFLLNDLVVCVSVSSKPGDEPAERLSLKWSVPLTEVEVQEASTSLTLSHVLTASGVRPPAAAEPAAPATELGNVGQLCQQMSDLMHDYEVVSRIAALAETLKGDYPELSATVTSQISGSIQRSVRQKDEEIAWLDACCLQMAVRRAGREEHFTFQMHSPAKKLEWTTDFRLAKLALDANNSPAWEVPEREQRPSARVPLFVKTMPVLSPAVPSRPTEVLCGCHYTLEIVKPTQRTRRQSYLWICTADGSSSYIKIYALQQVGFRDIYRLELPDVEVTCMEYVPEDVREGSGRPGSVWLCTSDSRLLVYTAQEPERCHQLTAAPLPSPARRLLPLAGRVFAPLDGATVAVFERLADAWRLDKPHLLPLGEVTAPASCLLPIGGAVYAGCGRQVFVIDPSSRQITKSFTVQEHAAAGGVQLLAHSGIGLWISLQHSSSLCLYHTETFRHLQDIDITSNVCRLCPELADAVPVGVTALLAASGLLWVGTSVGVTLTIPLPRLEGVPIVSGRGNVSYHGHCGPVRYLQVLASPHPPRRPAQSQQKRGSVIQEETGPLPADQPPLETGQQQRAGINKQRSDSSLSDGRKSVRIREREGSSSPTALRRLSRDREREVRRLSRTLPRGFSLSTSGDEELLGLYGELLNPAGLDEPRALDELGERLRRSEPELTAGLPQLRPRLRASRPRSLDLSTWSVDSRCSTQTASSSSDGDRSHSAPTSRAHSFRTPEAAVRAGAVGTPPAAGPQTEEPPRSVLTVMGGRGYVNWTRYSDKHDTDHVLNAMDAHIILWERKL